MKILYPNQPCPSCNKLGGLYGVSDDSPQNLIIYNGCNNCTFSNIVYRINPDGSKINSSQIIPTPLQTSTSRSDPSVV